MFKAVSKKTTHLSTLVGVFLSLVIGLFVLLFTTPAFASVTSEPAIPTAAVEWDQQVARVPDWSRISFRTLSPAVSDGSFSVPPEASQAVGYDLSRTWQMGQATESYLKLGDFQTSLYPQIFNLHTIAAANDINL